MVRERRLKNVSMFCPFQEFVTHERWMHMDIAGVMMTNGTEVPYLPKGMSGKGWCTKGPSCQKVGHQIQLVQSGWLWVGDF